MSKPKIFLACTGLGRINRGYETFTQECFDVLDKGDEFELYLFKGAGKSDVNEKSLWNLHRGTALAKFLAKLIGKDAYFIEQFTFFLSMLRPLSRHKPDIIYYSDFILGTFLWNYRKLIGLKYKLVFSNGAPNGPPFTRCDMVQQLLPCYLDVALNAGEPKEKHFLLPYGIKLKENQVLSDSQKKDLRKKLGLPLEKTIIISVGAINSSHKRMDYIVNEVHKLNSDEYFLLLLGQPDAESTTIIDLANSLLPQNHLITSVTFDRIGEYYQAADLFVLGSLQEGFGRVYMEALAYGLPVLTHDYAVSRQVLEGEGYYADFAFDGSLAKLINEVKNDSTNFEIASKNSRIAYVRNKYGWEVLKKEYIRMLNQSL